MVSLWLSLHGADVGGGLSVLAYDADSGAGVAVALVGGEGVFVRPAELLDPVLLPARFAVAGAVVGRHDAADGAVQGDAAVRAGLGRRVAEADVADDRVQTAAVGENAVTPVAPAERCRRRR